MKLKTLALALAITSLPLTAGHTAGGLSCDELDEAMRELGDLLDTLEDRGSVVENSSYDQQLLRSAETAIYFAEVEGNATLSSHARGMLSGWENKDVNRYIKNGDRMIEIYDRLYTRDC